MSLLLLLLLSAAADEPIDPPGAGRPESFRGAVGVFRIQASADPPQVPVGQPIRYVLRITADDNVPVQAPPGRPDVEKDPEFTKHFRIETPDPPGKHEGKSWEFHYLLRPTSTKVTAIPELEFSFYDPRPIDPEKRYQKRWTDPIPITVTPAPNKKPVVEGDHGLDRYPAGILRLADDADILERHSPFQLPGPAVLMLLALLPPLGALGWLLVWRRLYPDAARRAELRRSRAARDALKSLASARKDPGDRQAETIANILAVYLGHRFDLPATTPTPAETEAYLRGLGLPESLLTQARDLMQTCDALRFSAIPPVVSGSLTDAAEQLILALEGWTWSAPPS